MLTTFDLYTRPGYCIEIEDRVIFYLRRGLLIEENKLFPGQHRIERGDNPNIRRSITGVVTDYRPHLVDDLEVTIMQKDGSFVFLRLHQCRDLKKVEPI